MGNDYREVRATLNKVKLDNVYAYFSLILDDNEIEKFQLLSREEQIDWLYESADFIVDSYDVDDFGEIEEIIIN